jgi:hypothetical protein
VITKILKNIERNLESYKWRVGSSKVSSTQNILAHLLVVKNSQYSSLARVCIESFIFYHPNAVITVHCDSETYSDTKRALNGRFRKNLVQVVLDQLANAATWQEQKVQLITSLNGTHDVFMDADLRWNGVIPQRKGITFFVDEFSLKEKSPYRELLSNHEFSNILNPRMRNTSFFSFAGVRVEEVFLNSIMELQTMIENMAKSDIIGELDRESVLRISEQLALSLAVESWKEEIFLLKSSDGHMDGQFVESSYYGATGISF